MTENFANYPESLAEVRSGSNAALWGPRDVLISVLRDLDSGRISPDALIVCYREKIGPGNTKSHFRNMGPDVQVTLGLLAQTQIMMMTQGD